MRVLAGMAAGLICLAASVLSSPVRTKIRPWAPAELWPATRDMLAKLSADFSQTAVVLSLWAERPAHQCVVAARYAEAPADFGWLMHLSHDEAAEAPAGARAMLARLNAAGFAIGETAIEAPAKSDDAARRAA
ncbi:MAG: hypothetical protein WDM79_08700 [Terricaulis sp.]